ncbi:hypothetical protein [Mycobacterium asiaticum]|uniref:hypothetical protein n=1 Tax=Mycobacterium asiaticum TaxID=1790 RepID=UPI000B2CF5A7|nr:hypothetical protein [Mycobacterium asiaticum]
MIKQLSACTASRTGIARRSTRLIWVLAVSAGLAVSIGAGAADTFTNQPASVTATPEDPCLLNHTCGEDEPGAVEDMIAYCKAQRESGVLWTPECARFYQP